MLLEVNEIFVQFNGYFAQPDVTAFILPQIHNLKQKPLGPIVSLVTSCNKKLMKMSHVTDHLKSTVTLSIRLFPFCPLSLPLPPIPFSPLHMLI